MNVVLDLERKAVRACGRAGLRGDDLDSIPRAARITGCENAGRDVEDLDRPERIQDLEVGKDDYDDSSRCFRIDGSLARHGGEYRSVRLWLQ